MPEAQISPLVQPPTVTWPVPGEPPPPGLVSLSCPNCGSKTEKTYALTVDLHAPDDTFKRLHVVRCPACTCHFYDSQSPPDYAAPAMVNRGRVPFYVQQGAGVSLITRPLAQVMSGPGSAYMEVGCGYGFGLDYAINTKGWRGLGIDPAALSALGRDALGLPIELRYLRDDDEAQGTMDVVMGSEVIEHVTSPAAFIRTLRAMLRSGGTLILTTPNGDDITPDAPQGIIVPLLSPSLHLVIQSATSLRALLQQGGFAHTEIEVDSHSLVAFASDVPLRLERDPAALRAALRAHLLRRAKQLDRSTDLFLGFAGRALQEAVNDSDLGTADAAWALLTPACQARFQLSLDTITSLPDGLHACDLEEMARRVPLNLGGILYARAIRRLAGGTPRSALQADFTLAATAAAEMRRALGALAMEDGQTEEIEWTARAEAALSMPAGAAAIEAFCRLPPPPSGGPARLLTVQQRALSQWVDAGQHEAARAFMLQTGLHQAGFADPASTQPLTEAGRDALFAMATLDLDRPGAAITALARLARVRAASVRGGGLWWAALDAEIRALSPIAGPRDPAVERQAMRDYLRQHAAADWTDDRSFGLACRVFQDAVNTGEMDAAAAAWVLLLPAAKQRYGLDLATLRQLPPLDRAPPQLGGVLYARGIYLLATGTARPGLEPAFLLAAEASAQLRRSLDGRASQDGQAAETEFAAQSEAALCAAASGAPDAAQRLLDLPLPAGRLRTLQLRGLTEAVNAGHYTLAKDLARRAEIEHAAFAGPSSTHKLTIVERDAVFCLAVLGVQTTLLGRPLGEPAPARGRFARVRATCLAGDSLWWAALHGELQALDQMDAGEDAAALVREIGAAHPELALPDSMTRRTAPAAAV